MWQRRQRHQPTWTKIWLMMFFLLWLIPHLNPISPKSRGECLHLLLLLKPTNRDEADVTTKLGRFRLYWTRFQLFWDLPWPRLSDPVSNVTILQMPTAHVDAQSFVFVSVSYPVLIEMISMRGFFLILGRSSLAPPSLRPPSFFCPNRRTEWPEKGRKSTLLIWSFILPALRFNCCFNTLKLVCMWR